MEFPRPPVDGPKKFVFSTDCTSSILYQRFGMEQVSPLGNGSVSVEDFCSIFECRDWCNCLKMCKVEDGTNYAVKNNSETGGVTILLKCSYKNLKFTLIKVHHTDFKTARDEFLRRRERITSNEREVALIAGFRKDQFASANIVNLTRLNNLARRFMVVVKTFYPLPFKDKFKDIMFFDRQCSPWGFVHDVPPQWWTKLLGWKAVP